MNSEPAPSTDPATPENRHLLVDKEGRQWEFMRDLGEQGIVVAETADPDHTKLLPADLEERAHALGVATPQPFEGAHTFDKTVTKNDEERVVVRDNKGKVQKKYDR